MKRLLEMTHAAPLCATVLATTLVMAAAAPASASAFGCQFIKGFGFDFKGVPLNAPKGFLCHLINGSGRTITSEGASYSSSPDLYGLLAGRVCNWRIDFVYRSDATGNPVYQIDQGPTQSNCSNEVTRVVKGRRVLAHSGTACAELYVNGLRRAAQCHNILR